MAVAAATALSASVTAITGQAPSLSAPFLASGLALALASALSWWEIRHDLVEVLLGGLAAGAFGITLAEVSAQALTIPDHYKSLWIAMVMSALFVAHLAFRKVEGPDQRRDGA